MVLILALLYGGSIGTAQARSTGRLVVSRDSSLGRMVVVLRLDGRTIANLMPGSRFSHAVWTGRRVLSASLWPISSGTTSTVVNVRRGRTYAFTVARRWWGSSNLVLIPQGKF